MRRAYNIVIVLLLFAVGAPTKAQSVFELTGLSNIPVHVGAQVDAGFSRFVAPDGVGGWSFRVEGFAQLRPPGRFSVLVGLGYTRLGDGYEREMIDLDTHPPTRSMITFHQRLHYLSLPIRGRYYVLDQGLYGTAALEPAYLVDYYMPGSPGIPQRFNLLTSGGLGAQWAVGPSRMHIEMRVVYGLRRVLQYVPGADHGDWSRQYDWHPNGLLVGTGFVF